MARLQPADSETYDLDTALRLRTAEASAVVREDLRAVRGDLAGMADEIVHQRTQIADLGKGVLSIWEMIAGGPAKVQGGGLYDELRKISIRLSRIEERLERLEPAPAPPPPVAPPAPEPMPPAVSIAPPPPPAAPTTVVTLSAPRPRVSTSSLSTAPLPPGPPVTPARVAEPADDLFEDRDVALAPAWTRLATAFGLRDDTALLERIESGVERRLASSGSRNEAVVRSAFSQLGGMTLAHLPMDALRAFVVEFVGGGVDLISPTPGENFDPSLHEDFSVRTTGYRDRISDFVFPGVRRGGRVLLRAIVRT